jgi:hypothetical protein
MFISFNCVSAYIGLAKIYHFCKSIYLLLLLLLVSGDRVIGFIRLTISAIPFSSLFPFPFDFCCFRAVTARPITTFFKSALQFFFILIYTITNLPPQHRYHRYPYDLGHMGYT